MIPSVLFVIALLVGILLIPGSPRIRAPRMPGVEGIDDLDAARAYDLVSRMPPFRALRGLIASKLAKRPPAGILGDIGCGPGYLANLIADRHPGLRVIGVDASDEMVRAAEANTARMGLSNRVEFRLGDVARLPFEDGGLDFAMSTLALHHWSDPGNAFAEIYRVLKPGGRVMLFDLRRDARRRFYWLLTFVQSVIVPAGLRRINEPLGSLRSSYTPAEVEGMLRKTSFEEWSVEGAGMWMFVWMSKRG